jgi:acyl dehydratase
MEFPTLTYEGLTVGEEFLSDTYTVTPEEIETYTWAIDDHHPWFTGPSPFGGPIAPPTIAANQALRMRHNTYVVPAGLHAKMQYEFLEPIRPGMRVVSRGRVIDKYERRGRPYMVTEYVTVDEKNTPLVRGQFTQMIFRQATHVQKSTDTSPASTAPSPVGRPAGGKELPALVKRISQRQVDAYSVVRHKSIHTDEEWARAKGFRAPLVQAMMSTAYVSELMTHYAGAGFVKGGAIAMSFINPVYAGEQLTIRGVVRDRPDDAGRSVVDVWCENQQGQPTAVGTASALRPN